MERESQNEKLIVRYLLGDLPDDEQIRLEDRAFSDVRYMQNILAVEGDLIDDYLRGSLSDRKQEQFEGRFLASRERQQKVEFARALAKVASKSAVIETVRQPLIANAPVSVWDSLIGLLLNQNLAVQLPLAAAALVFVIGIPWLIARTIKLRGEIGQLQAERQTQRTQQKTLEQQVASERARGEELALRLERERAQRERNEDLARRLEQERGKLSSPQKDQLQPTIASLILLPISRNPSNRPKLVVPQAARLARLQIGLEREDEYQRFHVELRTAQGQEVWTQDRLRPRPSRAGRFVNLVIPGSVLAAGEYELALKGVMENQKTEDLRYYYFDVQKN